MKSEIFSSHLDHTYYSYKSYNVKNNAWIQDASTHLQILPSVNPFIFVPVINGPYLVTTFLQQNDKWLPLKALLVSAIYHLLKRSHVEWVEIRPSLFLQLHIWSGCLERLTKGISLKAY